MIGFYDYTVVLTYISLASSILGMISACYARIGWAIFFLGMSGLLDTFDGKVARTKKNRTEDQKRFGIQIDSLCDIVCFGVCPVIICWFSGMQALWEVAILIFYCLAGLIRLAYYNVMEEKRQQETDDAMPTGIHDTPPSSLHGSPKERTDKEKNCHGSYTSLIRPSLPESTLLTGDDRSSACDK